jgi:competence protein ComEA
MQFQSRPFGRALAAVAVVMALGAGSGWAVEVAAPAIDINQASAAELAALPGIGASKAQAIVDHRTAEPFRSVEDLKKVQGIGDRTFEALRSNITVGGAAE